MKLIKLVPRGFCDGVIESWKQVLKTKKDNPNKNIYMLGWFVHNKGFVDSLLKENIRLLDDTKQSRYDLINNTNFLENDIVITSAHGTEQKTIDLMRDKKIQLVDTTCKYVYDTHHKIKSALKQQHLVIYIGKYNHPETNSCIGISNDIKLVTMIDELATLIESIPENMIVSVFNQTTLSIYDLYEYFKLLKQTAKFKYNINNDICYATNDRQQVVVNNIDKFDILLVVGDNRSNNSNSLVKIAKSYNKLSYLITNTKDLDLIDFNSINSIAVTSGASTPTWETNNIINYLIDKFKIEEILDAE